jgi:hypothetical protein
MTTTVTPPTTHSNPTLYPSFAKSSNTATPKHDTPVQSSVQHQHLSQNTVPQQVHSIQTSSPTITVADLAKIMSAPKEVTRPLAFPSFKSSSDYNHWKQLCILKASKHPSSVNMTLKRGNKLIFNPGMSDELSSTLFLLTTDALGGAELVKLYGSIDIESANGLELWLVLDKTHMSLDLSAINKEMLSKEFNNLVREPNEMYQAFGIRFEKKKTHLIINKVPITTNPEQLALKLLLSLNEPIINQNICLNLNKHPEFFKGLTTAGIIEKASTYIKHYHIINKTKPSTPQSSSKLTPKDTKPKEPAPDKPTDTKPKPSPLSEKDKIKKLLTQANDFDSYLKGLQ